MDEEEFLDLLRAALLSITEPRLFDTERGYQGQLLIELHSRLAQTAVWPGSPALEQEYQKRLDVHGLTIRPDIIIHHPFERGIYSSRKQGNYVVFELKLRANAENAIDDIKKLSQMCLVLDYQIGVFININAEETYLEQYDGLVKERLHSFAIKLHEGKVQLREA